MAEQKEQERRIPRDVMSTCTLPEFHSLAAWIQTTDEHAEHHLALLARIEAVLEADAGLPAERASLAQKAERWRYQHLNEHAGTLTPEGEALVDSLDRAAKSLAGRADLPPRRTRHAVRDPQRDTAGIRDAWAVLDPAYPLPRLIERAAELTRQHFPASVADSPQARRHRILLYAPVYVSSDCVNYCTYCGFRYPLQIPRRHLTVEESLEQARILRQRGFRNILIVGGEFPSHTTPAYYRQVIQAFADDGFEPGIEIAPQSTAAYAELVQAGACSLTLYQETYDRVLYTQYHTRGPKASYDWRLESHDRAAEAGIGRLGLGFLLGLADPREDFLALLRHAAYLSERFPDRQLAFSLPRIHEAPEGFEIPFAVSDQDLIRFYSALRIAFPRAILVLSTREPPELRNTLAKVCITQMSAGSSTAPGGYGADEPAAGPGEQFPISDHRSPAEVAAWLAQEGFEIAWTARR